MACRTLALKQWRTEASTRLWNAAGVKNTMLESLVMPNCCLVALVKSEGLLNITELIEFLELWHGVSKHAQETFHCLEKNRPPPNPEAPIPNLPSKAERKAALQALRAFKKLKLMDNPLIAKEAQIVALRDQWLLSQSKANTETKARIKKAAVAKKKLIEKQDKARKKAKSKNQSIGMRRLALSNNRAVELGTFKDVLSNPATAPLEPDKTPTFSSNQLRDNDPALGPVSKTLSTADGLTAARLKSSEKKKAKGKTLSGRLSKKPGGKAPRVPTHSPVAMELIRPGKRSVKVPTNAVETLSGHLSKEPGGKVPRVPTPSPIAMELIRLGKRRVRVLANAVESIPPKRMPQSSLN